MNRIHIFILLCSFAIMVPASLSAHTMPKGSIVHSHDGIGEHRHDTYKSDPDQPLYAKLAECAAIYDSAVKKGQKLDEYLSKPHKDQLSDYAKTFQDKAAVIARKKGLEKPEEITAAKYDKVYKIWAERWYYIDDDVHYALITDNQIWMNYCDKLGKSLNILPQFSDIPE